MENLTSNNTYEDLASQLLILSPELALRGSSDVLTDKLNNIYNGLIELLREKLPSYITLDHSLPHIEEIMILDSLYLLLEHAERSHIENWSKKLKINFLN